MMKKIILFCAALLSATCAYAQGGPVLSSGIIVLGSTGRPVAGATVTFCSSSATGVPCSPTVSVFADAALTIPANNPQTTDGNGNVTVYAPQALYKYTVTGQGVSLAGQPYTAVVAGASGGGGGVAAPVTSLQYNNMGVQAGAAGITTPDGNILNVKGPVPWVDATQYGVRMLSAFNTITATTNGTGTVTTTGISDFIVNDGIVIPAAGAATAQSTPSAPTVSVVGATGAQTVNYKCVGVDSQFGLTAASAAGSSAVVPTVFGQPATRISSIARSTNVVTVTTGSAMPFTSGTYQARIANVTGGATQFSGLQTVTVTSGTTATYSQAGPNESGSLVAGSYILFEAASFVVTTVQATAGSNQLVLTTSINHNIPFLNSGTRPVRIFLDGIKFSGAMLPGYANGTFAVDGVTANTITVRTSFVSPTTTTAVADILSATSGVAQMTVTVQPVVDVSCPAISGTTKYYALYGDYGSGYAPIGFTPWTTNIFEDYGPAWTKSGLFLPAGMNLPATPPVAAQNQAYTGQITNINSSTLTVTPTVPASVSGATALHDNGKAFNNALAASCANGSNTEFNPVYLPAATSVSGYYLFSAPLDLTASGCNRANILDGGPLWLDGTMFASNVGTVEWDRPKDIAGWTNIATGSNSGGQVSIVGNAPTMMVSSHIGMKVSGMSFAVRSNTQTGLMIQVAANVEISNSSFSTIGANNLSAIPLYYYNAQFSTQLHNITWSCADNWMFPVVQADANSQLGDVAYWPVPCIEVTGAFVPKFHMDGINYGVYRGIQFDALYPNQHTLGYIEISDVDSFQAPQQGLINIYGDQTTIDALKLTKAIGDSVQNSLISCIVVSTNCSKSLVNEWSLSAGTSGLNSGPPWNNSFEILTNGGPLAQNTNELAQTVNGTQLYGPASGSTVAFPIYCTGGTGNALSVLDTTQTARSGITCPGGLLSIGGTTAFKGTATQANTVNRTYTFPDVTGTLPAYTISPTNNDCVNWSGTAGLQGDPGGACARFTITPVNGDCVTWSGTAGLLGDSGSACGAGGGGMNTNMNNMTNPTLMSQSLICVTVNTCALGTAAIPASQVFIGTVANQAVSTDTSSITANRSIKATNGGSMVIPQSIVAATHQFLTALNPTTGVFSQVQPALGDISGVTFSGPTTELATVTGAVTSGHAATWDASGNLQDGGTTVTASSTNTLTNKTLDQEGTGNVITTVSPIWASVAGCNNASAGPTINLATTQAPTPNCLTGSNVLTTTLDFDDSTNEFGQFSFRLPHTWVGNIDIDFVWLVTASGGSNAVKWTVATACSATGSSYDTAYNSAQTITTNVGANNIQTVSTQNTVTVTGCAVDNLMNFKLGRDTTDTFTGTARLLGVSVTLRHTGK